MIQPSIERTAVAWACVCISATGSGAVVAAFVGAVEAGERGTSTSMAASGPVAILGVGWWVGVGRVFFMVSSKGLVWFGGRRIIGGWMLGLPVIFSLRDGVRRDGARSDGVRIDDTSSDGVEC